MNILITGGAGFIGSNLAYYLLKTGNKVTIIDNLCRTGVSENIKWLETFEFKDLEFILGDIRDEQLLKKYIPKQDAIFHLAAQVGVTTSLIDPRHDFEVNVLGTFNILETVRKFSKDTILIYSSTNKVYGKKYESTLIEKQNRYEFSTEYLNGIDENVNIDFISPYGCSKGAAELYINDYHDTYGLKTVIFRQSCIYGQRQFGSVEQGWVFHFLKQAKQGAIIKIFGNGKQVRDVLHVNDLIDAYLLAVDKIHIANGKIYNIGGGIKNSYSLLEMIDLISVFKKPTFEINDIWRQGDQKYFVSDNSKIHNELEWSVKINTIDGLKILDNWVTEILR